MNVAVHPKGDRVAVGFYGSRAVEVYDTRDMRRLFAAGTADVKNGEFDAAAWSSDGTRLLAGLAGLDVHGDHFVRIWNQEGRGNWRDVVV
jgi:hypothetical protein